MGTGYGYGKVILLGEHFVVHGQPAIVSALGMRTIATATRTPDSSELKDLRPETPGYKKEKRQEQSASLRNIFRAMKIDEQKSPVQLTLEGDLVAASGVGASAASCAAIARALNSEFGLGLDDAQINHIAWEGEKGYHGTPSGIDNTAAVFGGVLLFRKDPAGGTPSSQRIAVPRPFEIVEGDTGITSSTKQAVEEVRRLKEEQPGLFEEILSGYGTIVTRAVGAIESSRMEELGILMGQNMDLLRRIRVSSQELEDLIAIALSNGAFGAKLTGTGRGGLMVALTPGKRLQEKVSKAIEKAGFRAFGTTIGTVAHQ